MLEMAAYYPIPKPLGFRFKMTFITQTSGFDLETELQTFVETCLKMLLRLPIKTSGIIVTMGEGNIVRGKTKFCHINIITSYASYHITQYGNSYEEALLC